MVARAVRRAGPRRRLLRPARAGDARRHRRQPAGSARGPVAGADAVRRRASSWRSRCSPLITLYGELRSISALVERIPGLRELDSWGRPSLTSHYSDRHAQAPSKTRFIFITGGVVSSLGKGIAAASIGRLLVARGADRGPAEVRPLHQRRPRHHVALPARRGVRHRGRRGDRSRPRPLRALHRRQHQPGLERHRRVGSTTP